MTQLGPIVSLELIKVEKRLAERYVYIILYYILLIYVILYRIYSQVIRYICYILYIYTTQEADVKPYGGRQDLAG